MSNLKELKDFLVKRQSELKEYRKIVSEWNEKYPSGSMMQFLQFTGLLK